MPSPCIAQKAQSSLAALKREERVHCKICHTIRRNSIAFSGDNGGEIYSGNLHLK
jgi:mono/diheme cytochrome c family protein